jgi:lysyl-tRNA synthetase class 2
VSELDEQIAVRRAKRERLRARAVEAFPARAPYDLEPAEARARWESASEAELEAAAVRLRVPGRIRALRDQGKLAFVDLHDGRAKLQLFVRKERLDPESSALLDDLDLGDYLLAEGTLGRTRTGELSLFAERLTLLAKALRPLPEKWHGLHDTELRYRQRYLDLVANPDARRTFEIRAAIVSGMRRFLDARGFLEVETPMMQPIAGGALARPFVTHHHALDRTLYLRIAPELYLKRLLVGGLHRVYEINRNFRNEGISTQHNPEFTMLEFYWAYADYEQVMDLVEEMISSLAREILNDESVSFAGKALELRRPWPRLTMPEALAKLAGVADERTRTTAGLLELVRERGLALPPELAHLAEPAPGAAAAPAAGPAEPSSGAHDSGRERSLRDGRLLAFVFEELCEEKLDGPVFVVDHPVEISPLAKQKPGDPRSTERFELYLGGMEIVNAFSELNDPDDQAERFRAQLAARAAGHDEAHRFDADYVRALEHGMPPAGGCGIGVDRLTMLFADRSSIRDVILFPVLRPEPGDAG